MRGRSMRPEGAENARRRASRPKAPPPAQGPPSLGYGSCPGMESSGAPARPPPGPSHTRWKSRPARPPARRDSHSSHSRGGGERKEGLLLTWCLRERGRFSLPQVGAASPPRGAAFARSAPAFPRAHWVVALAEPVSFSSSRARLPVRPHAAAGNGVGGNGIAGIGGGIERILLAGELAHLQRAGDVVAPSAHRVQEDVDAADVQELVVLIEHEGEDHSLEAVVAVLL